MQLSQRLQTAIVAAHKGGTKIMRFYTKKSLQIKQKTGQYDIDSLVTEADTASEKMITSELYRCYPEDSIYGEEGTNKTTENDYLWVVDPLDGTSNFVRNIPLFGISIGLIDEVRKTSVLGVLHFPALGITVYAEESKGCYLEKNGVHKKISVSNRKLHESLYWAGGLFKGKFQIHNELAKVVGLTKIIDSSSFEFAQIAMGNAEIYELVNILHDVAAGVCIVKEAGGTVTDENGDSWCSDAQHIVATNGIIHEEVMKILKNKN